jgi:anti-anti-sigma factor
VRHTRAGPNGGKEDKAFSIELLEPRSSTKTLRLAGRLDSETVVDLDRELDKVLSGPFDVLVFDLAGLEYTSSAGLRSFLRAQKEMGKRGGKGAFRERPGSREAVNLKSVFRNLQELDTHLDAMQKKTREEGEP